MPQVPYRTDFGTGLVHYDAAGIRSIGLPEAGHGADAPPADPPEDVRHLTQALEAYFDGAALFLPTCRLVGMAGNTELTKVIYRLVAAIPPGSTLTYGEVAEAAGRPGAARAVGAAMAANPFAPVIPCHRVVGADGSLRGYAGGLPMKRALLDMEEKQAEEAYV